MKTLSTPLFRYFPLAALVCGCFFAIAQTTATPRPDVEIIVNQHDDYVELFFSVSAHDLPPLFGVRKSLFTESDGSVDFTTLRTGTYDRADVMFKNVSARLNGEPVRFEAMSMMFHPKAERVQFDTPLDAAVAVSVCNVDDPNRRLTLADLHTYAGFISFTKEVGGTLTLQFEKSASLDAKVVAVTTFRGKQSTKRTNRLESGKLVIDL